MAEPSENVAKLVVTEGEAQGQEFPLENRVVFEIGRAPSSNIIIPDGGVAMNHCRIYKENGIYTLYDLNTTKGTYINGEKVTKQVLGDGDTIQMGPVLMVFWNPDGAPVVRESSSAEPAPDLEAPWEDDTAKESREAKDTMVIPGDDTVIEDLPHVETPVSEEAAPTEAKLTVLEGPMPGTVFPLVGKDKYTIGRASEADVKIMDIKISRQHSRIVREEGQFYVLDRDSRNGTFLNGEQIRKHPLKDGDHIKVGFTIMQFDLVEPATAASEEPLEMETMEAGPTPKRKRQMEEAAAPKARERTRAAGPAPKKQAAEGPQEFDCDLCDRTLSADDLSSGLAVHHQGKSYCLTCVKKLQNLASGAFQAPPSPGGETPRDNLDDSEIDLLLKEEADSEDSDLF